MARRVERLISVEEFRDLARRRLPKAIFEFIDGGALDELTLGDNRAGFDRLRLVPRVLADVSAPDLSIPLWDQELPVPLVICPMGSCMLAWPDADVAIARAAAARGVPYTLSTMSTTSIERMARSVEGALWFQLYVFRDYEFNRKLLSQAEAFGYSTLVITLDLQTGGKRERDIRNGISIPLRPGPRLLLDGMLHPQWALRFLRGGAPEFENIRGFDSGGAGMSIAARAASKLDDAMGLEQFRRLRDWWKGRVIVKGVMDPRDAVTLVETGADGIWISNHGGRQLDSAVSSIDAVPAIAAAVGARVPLLIDSGVRRGLDVIKARARGVSAAGIGRAAVYGVSAGEAGVGRVLDLLIDEIKNGMKLAGQPKFRDISSDLLLGSGASSEVAQKI